MFNVNNLPEHQTRNWSRDLVHSLPEDSTRRSFLRLFQRRHRPTGNELKVFFFISFKVTVVRPFLLPSWSWSGRRTGRFSFPVLLSRWNLSVLFSSKLVNDRNMGRPKLLRTARYAILSWYVSLRLVLVEMQSEQYRCIWLDTGMTLYITVDSHLSMRRFVNYYFYSLIL